ncbi:MAG TPA: hypothetical protein VGG42_17085, partial [Acidobacteriaceae bacterium]
SIEDVLAEARVREEDEEGQRWKKFFDENPETGGNDGVADAATEPSVMSFYAGRNYSEGRTLLNQHLVSRGKAPIPEGRR